MKTGVKPETVCELQDTNDHRQVERKWRLPISVGELSALEGRFIDRALHYARRGRSSLESSAQHSRGVLSRIQLNGVVSSDTSERNGAVTRDVNALL